MKQIGASGKSGGSNDTANMARPTQMRVDVRANEVFVFDGEQNQNHRVIVFDSETGAYKRHWGAYGERQDDAAAAAPSVPGGPPPKQFGSAVHCVNQKVWILRRDQMQVVGSFGERGAGAGQFATSLHDLTVDSKGNIYTGEAAAAGRAQKFALRSAAER